MVSEGEDALARLIVCVEGVPSFEFTLKCGQGCSVPVLMQKLRQYHYAPTQTSGLYSDEKCEQQLPPDSVIAHNGLYYLSMAQEQVEEQITKLFAPPPPQPPANIEQDPKQ